MPTANEEYQDRMISHAVGLRRLSSSTLRRVVAILNATRPDVRSLILDRMARIEERGFDIGPATTQHLTQLDADLARLLEDAHNAITRTMLGEMESLARYEVDYNNRAAAEVLPVAIQTVALTPEQLQKIVYSQPFQGKVLRDHMADFRAEDRARIMRAIRMGMVEGETPTQIARRVEGTGPLKYKDGVREVSRRGLQTITQTATSHVANRARQAWAIGSGVVRQEAYVATLDSKTTLQCSSLDGRVFDVGKGPTPPLHYNCRSTRAAVFDDGLIGERPANAVRAKELEGLSPSARKARVRELVGPVPAETTFEQWLSRRPKGFVDDYLGPGRAELWRNGKITLRDLVDRNGQPWTLAELARREGLAAAA